jgi:hypothetical protein
MKLTVKGRYIIIIIPYYCIEYLRKRLSEKFEPETILFETKLSDKVPDRTVGPSDIFELM